MAVTFKARHKKKGSRSRLLREQIQGLAKTRRRSKGKKTRRRVGHTALPYYTVKEETGHAGNLNVNELANFMVGLAVKENSPASSQGSRGRDEPEYGEHGMLYGPFAPDGIEIMYPPGETISWIDVADQLGDPRGTPKDAEVLEVNGYRADGSYYSFTVWGSKKTGRITQAIFDRARDEAEV